MTISVWSPKFPRVFEDKDRCLLHFRGKELILAVPADEMGQWVVSDGARVRAAANLICLERATKPTPQSVGAGLTYFELV